MKKVVLVFALMFSISAVVMSCKGDKKEHSEEESEMNENHAASDADMAMNDVYQCPMDCEDGKTYDKEGNCPVCKMALKKVEEEHAEDDNDEGHTEDHDGDGN